MLLIRACKDDVMVNSLELCKTESLKTKIPPALLEIRVGPAAQEIHLAGGKQRAWSSSELPWQNRHLISIRKNGIVATSCTSV